MDSRIESRVWDYIVARRPLKLALVATFAIGLVHSTITGVMAAIEPVAPILRVGIGIEAPAEKKRKYACILQFAREYFKAVSSLSSYAEKAIDQDRAHEIDVDEMAACAVSFGFTPLVSGRLRQLDDRRPVPEERVWLMQSQVTQHAHQFEAYLLKSDIAAYRLLQIGKNYYSTILPPRGIEAAAPVDADIVVNYMHLAKESHEVQYDFKYSMPVLLPDFSSYNALNDSRMRYRDAMKIYFNLPVSR